MLCKQRRRTHSAKAVAASSHRLLELQTADPAYSGILDILGGFDGIPRREFLMRVGDHTSHLVGWQEGVARSGKRAVQMISGKVSAARLEGKYVAPLPA